MMHTKAQYDKKKFKNRGFLSKVIINKTLESVFFPGCIFYLRMAELVHLMKGTNCWNAVNWREVLAEAEFWSDSGQDLFRVCCELTLTDILCLTSEQYQLH